MVRYILALFFLLSIPFTAWGDDHIVVGHFSVGDMEGWEKKIFTGETHYRLIYDGDLKVLEANSKESASGLVRKVVVDLSKTPYLHWSWKVHSILPTMDEHKRSGDDYPARVYVVFSGGFLFWRTRALNYVWSSNQPVGSVWENAYTSQARMIAVESGSEFLDVWRQERRNIQKDYERAFGETIEHLDAVAIMTDTDNSGGSLISWYGDLWFSSQ